MSDIEKLKKANYTLLSQFNLAKCVLDSLSTAIIAYSNDYHDIVFANEAAKKLISMPNVASQILYHAKQKISCLDIQLENLEKNFDFWYRNGACDQDSLEQDIHIAILYPCEMRPDKNRDLLIQLINNSSNVVFISDQHHNIAYYNEKFEKSYASKKPGDNLEDCLSLIQYNLHLNSLNQIKKHKEPVVYKETITRDFKNTIYETRKFLIAQDDTNSYFGTISRDITEEVNRYFLSVLSEQVFLHASDGIVITDNDLKIVRTNPAFEKLTGFNSKSLEGRHIRVLQSKKHDEKFYSEMWDSITRSGSWNGEVTNKNAFGHEYVVNLTVSKLMGINNEQLGYIAIENDVTEKVQTLKNLEKMATLDPLTLLPNRTVIYDRIEQEIKHCQRHTKTFCLLFADLDHFKDINDSLGHNAGDQLLKTIAGRIKKSVREEDTVARFGGDEFIILLVDVELEQGIKIAEKIRSNLKEPVEFPNGVFYTPKISLGLVEYPKDGTDVDTLIRHADIAMYESKNLGRDMVSTYQSKMSEEQRLIFDIKNNLQGILNSGSLELYIQPKICIEHEIDHCCGGEILLRWNYESSILSPATFLRHFEKAGVLVELDHWVLKQTIKTLSNWIKLGLWDQSWVLSVNQNANDILKTPNYAKQLVDYAKKYNLDPQCLAIELTEDVFVENTQSIKSQLELLSNEGFRIKIDDFGSGYSNLLLLKQYPIDTIKIDKSFVRDITTDENDHTVVEAIVEIANKMGYGVIAEGVETVVQRDELKKIGVKQAQGFLWDTALSLEDFEKKYL